MKTFKPAEVFPPGDFIADELEERGWSQADLAEILGKSETTVSLMVTGRRSITPGTAKDLSAAFGSSPQYWMNLQALYDLWRTEEEDEGRGVLTRRAALFSKGPIKEMKRRGWLGDSDNVDELERRVREFFDIQTLDGTPVFAAAARKSTPYAIPHTPAQIAWLCRCRQLARAVSVARPYKPEYFDDVVGQLKALREAPEEIRRIPRVLSDYGIRFVVVEFLPGTKIDGASFWLSPEDPVIAVALRFDRIDHLWWLLLHELAHVKNRDDGALDTDIWATTEDDSGRPDSERKADQFASENILPQDHLANFIARVGPTYTALRIEGFAKIVGVHPGIVVGQLHHRHKNYSSFRKMLVPVRHILTEAALTDGWGKSVNL